MYSWLVYIFQFKVLLQKKNNFDFINWKRHEKTQAQLSIHFNSIIINICLKVCLLSVYIML